MTLFGHGQGATCALLLSVSTQANDLFDKVIALSPEILNVIPKRVADAQSEALANYVAKAMGHDNAHRIADQKGTVPLRSLCPQIDSHRPSSPGPGWLQKAPGEAIVAAQAEDYQGCFGSSPLNTRPGWGHLERLNGAPAPDPTAANLVAPLVFEAFQCCPVVDGEFLVAHPLTLLEQGAASHIRVILGANRESLAFVPDVYQGGNTFESVNDPRSYEFGLPPFLMHGLGLWAESEEEAKKLLDVDGDGILTHKELVDGLYGRLHGDPKKVRLASHTCSSPHTGHPRRQRHRSK